MYFLILLSVSDIKFNIILGGFGLFLLGIKLLGDGFKEAAGPKIRDYIEKYTGNLLSAILVGTIITALMQSSTAATVISISLVRAGLMSLEQAIGISVGANLGTTVTALMTGLNIEDLGYYFVFLGSMIIMFFSRKKHKTIGQIIFGLGITFVGLELMGEELLLLQKLPQFESFLVKMSDNPWLALLAGTIATALLNSSMAVIVIVQKIYAGGGMSMAAASGFVFGSNVGTTLTAVLASLGGSVSTKRAGWFHALYNVLGAVLTMFVITPYSNLILQINEYLGGSPEMAIGINHFVFNLAWVILIIPFIPICINLLSILIPGEDRIQEREKIEPLNYQLIQTFPDGALQLAEKQIIQMSGLVQEAFHTSRDYLLSHDQEDYEVLLQIEDMINELDHNLTRYLLEIAKESSIQGQVAQSYTSNLEIINNLERVGDISVNLIEFYHKVYENRGYFSQEALVDLTTMYELVFDMLKRSILMLENDEVSGFERLLQDEDYLDIIEEKYKEKHYGRISAGICNDPYASSVYTDILGNLERIGDHSVNIVKQIKNKNKL